MRINKLVLLLTVTCVNTMCAQQNGLHNNPQSIEKSCLELPQINVFPIKDSKTGRQYELYIKLPLGYAENKDVKYPVIYFTDALWHIEILSGSVEYIMEKTILVGVSWQKDIDENTIKEVGVHASRFRDYSIQKSNNPERQAKYEFGQAHNHLSFIRNDVIKYVENNYRTAPDNRTYFSYSLGGVLGAYILLAHHRTFKNYILGSPSLKGDIPYLSDMESNMVPKNKSLDANVFISYGTLEKDLGMHIDKFVALLKARNDKHLILKRVVIEGSHQTAFPMTAVRSMYWLSEITKE